VAKFEALFEKINGKEGLDAATTTTLGTENPSSAGIMLISTCAIITNRIY
jgi:hypothetical protein